MNEFLFFLTLIVTFIMVAIAHRVFGKIGLIAWAVFAGVVANIEVAKCIDLFGLSVTLGNVTYGSVSLALDGINARYGAKEARKTIILTFGTLVCFVVVSQMGVMFKPNEVDVVAGAMATVFSFTPRICVASLVAFLISANLNVYIFNWLKKHTSRLWVKNNMSTMVSQFIDSTLFTIIAFWGIFPAATIGELIITTYIIKLIVAVLDTPFIYYIERK